MMEISMDGWSSLNDTIMGGRSSAGCRMTDEGLLLEGELIEQGGDSSAAVHRACNLLWI